MATVGMFKKSREKVPRIARMIETANILKMASNAAPAGVTVKLSPTPQLRQLNGGGGIGTLRRCIKMLEPQLGQVSMHLTHDASLATDS